MGVVALNMNRSKIGFDTEEYKQIYKGQETEKVWIDFGKVNSNVLRFDPSKNPNMNFNGHKLYYMLPPSMSLLPSNVIMFELVYLSSKEDITKDIVVGWGAFPIVNGEFEINTGKFKVPILYGRLTAGDYEDAIAADPRIAARVGMFITPTAYRGAAAPGGAGGG